MLLGEGCNFLGTHFWLNTGPPHPHPLPPVVNDRSLNIVMGLFLSTATVVIAGSHVFIIDDGKLSNHNNGGNRNIKKQ